MSYFPRSASYFDSERGKYLEDNVTTINFYLDATSRKNQFMYQVPGVASSDAPFSVIGHQVITGLECRLRDAETGDVISLKDADTGATIFTITLNNEDSYINNSLNIDIIDKKLAAYINGILINIPVLKVHLKQVFIP